MSIETAVVSTVSIRNSICQLYDIRAPIDVSRRRYYIFVKFYAVQLEWFLDCGVVAKTATLSVAAEAALFILAARRTGRLCMQSCSQRAKEESPTPPQKYFEPNQNYFRA